MASILWTPAGVAEVSKMGPRLRKADKAEIRAVSGADVDLAQHMANAVSISRYAFVGRDPSDPSSDPFVVYGVADDPTNEGFGAIWMVCTPKIMPFRRALLREAPDRIQWLHERKDYPRGLHNLVHARNKTHVKWLRRMGATFPQAGKVALINNEPFLYFRFIHV